MAPQNGSWSNKKKEKKKKKDDIFFSFPSFCHTNFTNFSAVFFVLQSCGTLKTLYCVGFIFQVKI